jgi:ribose 5-phosphate isomerase B
MARKIKVSIAADHGGFGLKEALKERLKKKGYDVTDFGTDSEEACDYPFLGYNAALAVSRKKADFGIVICKTGFGMAIIANKVKAVRSAVCDSVEEARSAREHNHCNVLSLAATRVTPSEAMKIAEVFLGTECEGGRHLRRVEQIINLEKKK